ncbi:hypothetical protein Tco_0977691 [Tanacetum coccineum]|uniref:Myb-like domain-containing protein n=1 Tax=Tanacetum coccineum TaxID=301880 RepID=A0ABQ5EKX6_9ASTR
MFFNNHNSQHVSKNTTSTNPPPPPNSIPKPTDSLCAPTRHRLTRSHTVDLVDENEEEEEHVRQCARWTREEEILLTQCWIETSENGQIGADRSDDSFWGQIMDDFNTSSTQGYRTRHILTGKWTRTNADCQKFNAIYKHLERKSEENEADHIEAAKITFAAQQPKGRNRPKRPQLTAGSSGEVIGVKHFILSILQSPAPQCKAEHGIRAKKAKEMAMIEFKEMEFLTIDADSLPEPKASIIRSRQEKIIAKYTQQ